MQQVRHRLSVHVSRRGGQRRVDVGVGVDPNDTQVSHRRRVTVNGADRQTEEKKAKVKVAEEVGVVQAVLDAERVLSLAERVEKVKVEVRQRS